MPRTKILILLTVFIDVIGVGIIIPILPFYLERFSSSPMLITALFAVFALCSFFSAPVTGAASDRVGRRPMLIVSLFSTALGWFVFAGATNIAMLLIGRILDGIMAGNFPIAQSYLSDLSKNNEERTTNLGLIGAVFGVGFILGPLLGGILGHFGQTVPFWFVGFLALANGTSALFFLPETHAGGKHGRISLNPFLPIYRALGDGRIRNNYAAWFLFGMAIAGFQAVFALYLRDIFGYNAFVSGLVYAAVGVGIVVNQGFAMKHIWLKHFREPVLELGMLGIFIIGFLLLSIPSVPVFFAGLLLTTFGHSVLRVVMTSQVVGFAGQSQRGEVLGIMSSIASLSMTVSPLVSGLVYQSHPVWPFLFGAGYLCFAFLLLYSKRKKLAAEQLPEDIVMETQV